MPVIYLVRLLAKYQISIRKLYLDRKEARRIPRSTQIAVAAAAQALTSAGLPEIMPVPERTGVVFGTAIGGLDRFDEGIQTLRTRD